MRRPTRAAKAWRVLAFIGGLGAAWGIGFVWGVVRQLREDVATEARISSSEISVERESREAQHRAESVRYFVLQARMELLEHDNAECHALTSLP